MTRRQVLKHGDRIAAMALTLAAAFGVGDAIAAESGGFLETIHHHTTLTTTVPDNGDQNPYALAVAPVSAGKIAKDDLLIDNFNDKNNLQGLGTTIVDYNPTTKNLSLFAQIPRHLDGCPAALG